MSITKNIRSYLKILLDQRVGEKSEADRREVVSITNQLFESVCKSVTLNTNFYSLPKVPNENGYNDWPLVDHDLYVTITFKSKFRFI